MRRTTGITGAGAVLLAMLMIAILIGLGSTAIEAYEQRSTEPAAEESSNTNSGQAVPTAATDAVANAPIVVNQPESTSGPLYQAPTGVTAIAVHAWRLGTDELLIDRDAGARMQVGSIVKIATALVALQFVGLDEEVLIDSTDLVDPAVYSNMALVAGDTLTVEQLLQGLLIPSGGDAAEALARHVGEMISGSDDPASARTAFVDEMNAYAARLGLEDTRFANASGDDNAGSYSTAHDISILAAELLKSPELTAIVETPSYEFTSVGGNVYTGFNTNAMLGEDGVIGVKTGSTGDAGGCVVLAQPTADGGYTITTILGSYLAYNELNQIVADARWDDARLIFDVIDP